MPLICEGHDRGSRSRLVREEKSAGTDVRGKVGAPFGGKNGQGLIAQVKTRADVRLVPVNDENRDRLPKELEGWVRAGFRSR